MILIIDCFKLVKGAGKSIGIYNLALNLVRNLVAEKEKSTDAIIQNTRILVLGTEHNSDDFKMDGVEFISMKYNPLNKLFCIFWELFWYSFMRKNTKLIKLCIREDFLLCYT